MTQTDNDALVHCSYLNDDGWDDVRALGVETLAAIFQATGGEGG